MYFIAGRPHHLRLKYFFSVKLIPFFADICTRTKFSSFHVDLSTQGISSTWLHIGEILFPRWLTLQGNSFCVDSVRKEIVWEWILSHIMYKKGRIFIDRRGILCTLHIAVDLKTVLYKYLSYRWGGGGGGLAVRSKYTSYHFDSSGPMWHSLCLLPFQGPKKSL
jgi:hypothetical protein